MSLNYWILLLLTLLSSNVNGCQFYPVGEYLRFVRVPENLIVGGEVIKIQVHPRDNLTFEYIDKKDDINYFTYRDINSTTISILLARSLEDLVDRDNPQNVLKFRLTCSYKDDDEELVSSYLSVTVYVEDVNDHAPTFVDAPYHITVDELTPVGLTIYRGIQAFDRDKPNTPNSDVQYTIAAGDPRGRFALESSHRALLVVKKPLDYDNGDRDFSLTISASDRGSPPKTTNTTIHIAVLDNDDLNPKFTQDVYRTQITEFYPITGSRIHQELKFKPRIFAYDQDIAIDAPVRYDIIAGNDRQLFALDPVNATLFLEKEIDLDNERRLPGNTFILQIQASQMDNPLKTAVTRVEVEVLDINDNLPEFEVDFYNISIVENLPNGFSVLQVIASDKDQGINGDFAYVLEDKTGAFNLESRTGWLTVRDQSILDREKQQSLSMKVYAKERVRSVVTDKDLPTSVTIEITLLDANDNNPTFIPSNLYEFSIYQEADIGDLVGIVKAVDPDMGRNGMVLYDIQHSANGTQNVPFTVDAQTGRITVVDRPLLEGRHAIFIEASDQPANPSERRYSLAVVTIEVIRTSKMKEDELPNFIGAPYEFWVGGNVGVGTSIGQIRINEAARKHNILFDLLHSYHDGVPFAVEERSGTITVISELDKFERIVYDFEGVVTNEKDLTLVTNVTIHVVDPEDERGVLMKGTSSSPIEFRVRENMSGAMIGRLFYQTTGKNSTKSLRFVIANQADVTDYIAISQDGTLYTRKGLDREERDIYRMTIIAEYNKGYLSGAGIYQVTVYVDDENDNPPVFSRPFYEGRIKENSPHNTEVNLNYQINATDIDKGVNAQFTLNLFGDGQELFHINQTTGILTYRGNENTVLDRELKPIYNFRIVARDKGSLSSEVKLTVIIEDENDNPPTFLQVVILPAKGVNVIEYDENYSNLTQNKNNTNILMMSQNLKMPFSQSMYLAPRISIPENISTGTPILRLLADDKDFGENAELIYSLASETVVATPFPMNEKIKDSYFIVQPTSGEIIVAKSLPAETDFRLNISATDKGGLADNVTIRINIRDLNDHAPLFDKQWYSFDVPEASYSRTILGKLQAKDNDYGQNANVSYYIKNRTNNLPFIISEFTGILTINGDLDRESQDQYLFQVLACDNSLTEPRLTSTVDVEINILDINDNAPIFYGYDEIIRSAHPEAFHLANHNFESVMLTPIYYASVVENSPIGTVVTKVFANDSDFLGNGNGLLLFDIPHRKNLGYLFAVDSKDGIVTTTGKLDYETQNSYNVTIVASDLGSPSLSSTALLIVKIIDIPEDHKKIERPVFANRYFELEVEENVQVPLKLLTLNVTDSYKSMRLRFSIISKSDHPTERMFRIDPKNGTLILAISPDREKKDTHEIVVRVDRVKTERGMMEMIYPIGPERLTGLRINEVKIKIRVTDVNDNYPIFKTNGRPIVAAIPTSANFGYHILRLEATDADIGVNSEIRYQILGRAQEHYQRFTIDPITGQIRSVSSFARESGRVFGFDVKATDKRGADDGKSAIANVFVYVLDDDKQLVMIMGMQPTDIEKHVDNITSTLYNVTGYDVRVRKLEPHSERNLIDSTATDMYLYAVDPSLNVIIDMNILEKILHKKQEDIERQLEPYHVLNIASGTTLSDQSRGQRYLLSSMEIGVIILGCVIFIVALATAICISCTRYSRRKSPSFGADHSIGYALTSDRAGKTSSSTSFDDPLHSARFRRYVEPLRTNVDLPSRPSTTSFKQPLRNSVHDINCSRYNGNETREHLRVITNGNDVIPNRNLRGIETSVTSLHSSGKDSGIVDSGHEHHVGRCNCGHSTTQSSTESTNSYEDSLKSEKRATRQSTRQGRNYSSSRKPNVPQNQIRRMRHSFHDDLIHPSHVLQRYSMVHPGHSHNSGPLVLNTSPNAGVISRRHSDRLVITCPLTPP